MPHLAELAGRAHAEVGQIEAMYYGTDIQGLDHTGIA